MTILPPYTLTSVLMSRVPITSHVASVLKSAMIVPGVTALSAETVRRVADVTVATAESANHVRTNRSRSVRTTPLFPRRLRLRFLKARIRKTGNRSAFRLPYSPPCVKRATKSPPRSSRKPSPSF